jgi:hypothetical protein
MSKITEKATPLLCLDLDGTVRHGLDELGRFVNGPEDVVVFPEAVEMMRRWKAGGGRIIAVSNQGGIALGHMSMDDCAKAMLRTNDLADRLFDKMCWCSHHPQAEDPEYARCWCRKPRSRSRRTSVQRDARDGGRRRMSAPRSNLPRRSGRTCGTAGRSASCRGRRRSKRFDPWICPSVPAIT